MKITRAVEKVLSNYTGETVGVKTNLARLLMSGSLKGTGRLLMLAVDQGFEHGPGRSFQSNPAAYDPLYHFQMAADAGVSAYAAPLGMLEVGADRFLGRVPLVLKLNSSNTLVSSDNEPDQAMTASVQDAVRLGCVGVGFTLYSGADTSFRMIEDMGEQIREAKSAGLCVIIWSYPRGAGVSKAGETALDIVAYGVHMAALCGAHIIKAKLPTAHIEHAAHQHAYASIEKEALADRVRHVVRCSFEGRRLVLFSGGEAKSVDTVLEESHAIRRGGGHGSVIGRNSFQRPQKEGIELLRSIQNILRGGTV